MQRLHAITIAFVAFSGAAIAEPAEDARALLEARCFECHDGASRKGGLAMAGRDAFFAGGDSHSPAVVPGDPAGSELIARVTTSDSNSRMPAKGEPLTESEIELLRTWIADGANWPEGDGGGDVESSHWAFNPPVQPDIPNAGDSDWPRNPIDAFILEKMGETGETGLTPSPEADRATLIRRVTLDLTGLPPTPVDVREFVTDPDPNAYEALVERLLASPQYGERQARRWLDLARYADTNGYEKDRERSIWPYRDWVIDAYNRDLPYDQFVVQQLAGDLLPNATEAQRVATGFHRNAMLNEEGGIDAAEFLYHRQVDRVNTTSTVFLGLTMACAQCHTHKYDPITQKEYFQFLAFFDGADEVDFTLHDDDIEAKRETMRQERARVENFVVGMSRAADADGTAYAAWRDKARADATDWTVARPVAFASKNGATLNKLDDNSILASGDIPNDDTYTVDLLVEGESVSAIRLEVLPHETLTGGGPGRGNILAEGDFLLTEFRAEAAPWQGDGPMAPIEIAAATADYAPKNFEAAKALDDVSDTGWSIKGAEAEPHAAVFTFAEPVAHEGGTRLRLTLHQDYIHQHTIGRFRVLTTSTPGASRAFGMTAELERALATNALTEEDEARLSRHYHVYEGPAADAWRKRRGEFRNAMPQHPTTLVFTERAEPRTTYIRHRGEFLNPRSAVGPGVPAVLNPLPENTPRTRMALAQWIVDDANPLTARVAVNRLWIECFGRGLVATPEDFGVRSDSPSHPALLDWLAVEFRRRGWSVKDMLRLMVTSATYRQASHITPDALELDPENRFLSRAPRLRVEAEVLRDFALSVSGLLNDAIGGPSVHPPQPAGVTALAYGGPGWPTDSGPDRYRRGLYTYMKRTAPYAMATTFDAPSGEETCVMRRRTNTPLQALTLMNDTVFMETAKALAERVCAERDDFAGRLDRVFMLCLSRTPDAYERDRVEKFLERERTASPDATDVELWTLLCRAVLNLDETITRG